MWGQGHDPRAISGSMDWVPSDICSGLVGWAGKSQLQVGDVKRVSNVADHEGA